jgi:hypothetical protein
MVHIKLEVEDILQLSGREPSSEATVAQFVKKQSACCGTQRCITVQDFRLSQPRC